MSKTTVSESLTDTSDSPTILIVDDDKDLADTYSLWLSGDFDVETAYGGVQAREQIHDGLDLVLLDRRMPGIPGDRVLEDIRDRGIDCQVAMLTAVEPDTDIIELPFDEYLVKPVTQSELRETVDDLLLRQGFDADAQEFFAMESKADALETRDEENLRNPDAAADLEADAEQARESERIRDMRERLQRLQRISSVIRDIDKQLVVATSRQEIERTVCERLVDSDPYELAWIGDYTVSFDQVTPSVMACRDDATLNQDTVADGGSGPAAEAVSTGEVQVVDDFSTDRSRQMLDPIGSADSHDRFEAGAVVPLTYRDTVYGVLNVCTTEADVFDEREITVLSELGDSVANAINSVEHKKLMLSDTVVELEFDVQDRSDIFVSLSAETESRIELKSFVPAANGELTSYVEVTGTTTEAFLDAATGIPEFEKVRGIGESNEQNLYECRVSDSTVVLSLIDAGANVESMRIDEGQGHIAATVAPDTDVRTVADTIQERFDDIDLVAKREIERDFQSTESFRQSLENRLTDRQYSILEAAYAAGYFAWPRESTAKEIADSLDLAPPTLHEHLRGAKIELIEAFFEETGTLDEGERLRDQ
ncbi:bacterio-opsin activator domain-containing protein [Haloplanus aerogenes]|uniref:Putative DNA binding protein n=1 Tax=Haloplanus aerogenes TaxID=660522 RepID=A0A3M0DT16_9EURY|nr:bacterio-opsin activator domain-containing protein [Haloplanus aerogenes]AZH26078.1 response regulator [Haloplanus aerogenes]RMB18473.1 putative DNA binding protein [Haloplanus aerogenes]